MKESFLYESMKEHTVRCNVCNHRCIIKDGKRGICGVRENDSGTLNSLVYGKLIATHVDPIEKKPLFHLMPGSLSYSIATVGCNLKCLFCQNADIAQMPSDRGGMIMGENATPRAVVKAALKSGCKSISYTYTEPTIYVEFAHDTAKLAREQGLKNVFVTNGYMSSETIRMIQPHLDAANVDLKSFSDDFYKKYCGARLEPVKNTLKQMKSSGILVEATTLVIPGLNDDKRELEALAAFLVNDLGPDTPWHISRFHPTYKLTNCRPTPVETLDMARGIGIEAGLRYVYTGNVPGDSGEKTCCHECGKLLIDRWGFGIRSNRIENGACPDCGAGVYGIGL